jgi:hypothetical protein
MTKQKRGRVDGQFGDKRMASSISLVKAEKLHPCLVLRESWFTTSDWADDDSVMICALDSFVSHLSSAGNANQIAFFYLQPDSSDKGVNRSDFGQGAKPAVRGNKTSISGNRMGTITNSTSAYKDFRSDQGLVNTTVTSKRKLDTVEVRSSSLLVPTISFQ